MTRGRMVRRAYTEELGAPLGVGPWAGYAVVDAQGRLIGWASQTPRLYAGPPAPESLQPGWEAVPVTVTLRLEAHQVRHHPGGAHGVPVRCDSCGHELLVDCPNHCANAEASVDAKPGTEVAALVRLAKPMKGRRPGPRPPRFPKTHSGDTRRRILAFLAKHPTTWQPATALLALFPDAGRRGKANIYMCVRGCVKRGEIQRAGPRGRYQYRAVHD